MYDQTEVKAVFFRRARAEAEPFETLAQRFERRIYLLCLRMMGRREDAEDCAQEALLNAWRAYGSFREQANPGTWLYRIAYNTCVDALRKRRGETSLETLREQGFDPAETRLSQPAEAAERKELRRQILEAVRLLPPDQRAALVLRDFQQRPYQEIAEVLGVSEGTVKSRISRARERVKKYLMDGEQNAGARVQRDEGRQK